MVENYEFRLVLVVYYTKKNIIKNPLLKLELKCIIFK